MFKLTNLITRRLRQRELLNYDLDKGYSKVLQKAITSLIMYSMADSSQDQSPLAEFLS